MCLCSSKDLKLFVESFNLLLRSLTMFSICLLSGCASRYVNAHSNAFSRFPIYGKENLTYWNTYGNFTLEWGKEWRGVLLRIPDFRLKMLILVSHLLPGKIPDPGISGTPIPRLEWSLKCEKSASRVLMK